MHLNVDSPVLELAAGQHFFLDDARGARIEPVKGTLWITEEGEPQDFVVAAGDVFLVSRPGRTVVQAMDAARVWLRDEGPRAANDA